MKSDFINQALGITENFQMPEKLLGVLLSKDKNEFLDKISAQYDFGKDDFRDYFQAEHSDRDKLKQDYTPDCICKLISLLSSKTDNLLDVCSGTGALSISCLSKNRNIKLSCEELSARAIPVLLCNMAIRNVNALISQKDVLTQKVLRKFELVKSEKYSDIRQIENFEEAEEYDLIVSNPPYSLSWNPPTPLEACTQRRFKGYDLPPKSKADYAFVLDIASRLSENGEAYIILPHGVLFRGQNEGKIRRTLIENNLINAIIGLPNNLFMNTGIPTCVLCLKKDKQYNDILFIDASRLFIKSGKVNDMTAEHLNKVVAAYNLRANVEKLTSVVNFKRIEENDFNLNIPRYVDTFERPEVPDIMSVSQEIMRLEEEARKTGNELGKMLFELRGDDSYNSGIEPFAKWLCAR